MPDTTDPPKTDEAKANETALNVLETQGQDAFFAHIFKDQQTGVALTYAQMRERYG